MPSFFEDVTSGDHVKALSALRDQITADIAECESMRDKAALYLRLSDVLAQLSEARPAEVKVNPLDEIAKRRAARRSSAG